MSDLSNALDVDQAAQRLGVSRQGLYRLIADGAIDAHKFADRWVIPAAAVRRAELAPRPAGRPFSVPASWGLIRLMSHLDAPSLSRSRLAQLRRHLREDDPRRLAGRLRNRALRKGFFAHPSVLPRLLADPRVVPSGVSALEEVGADLVVGLGGPSEGYVAAGKMASLLRDFKMAKAAGVENVVLHVVDDSVDVPSRMRVAVPAVVALDLIESGDSRSVGAGWGLWADTLKAARDA